MLLKNKKIDLSDYNFDELIFTRDMTREDISHLIRAYTNFVDNGYVLSAANSINA